MCKHRSIKKAEIDYSSRVWLLGTVPVAPLLRFESFDAVHTSSRRLWFESPKGPVFISRGHSTQHNLVFTTMIAHTRILYPSRSNIFPTTSRKGRKLQLAILQQTYF
jgi:hypothetical protein